MSNLAQLLDCQTELRGVRVNFVVNSSGNFAGKNGSSRDISNQQDLALLKKLRSLSKVIVTDAQTARRENYRASKFAPIEIWSKSGELGGISPEPGLFPKFIANPETELENLREKYGSVLLETGPTLTRILAGTHLVDELKLTVVGCASPTEAERIAHVAAANLGLDYLHLLEFQTVAESYFFTFGR